MRRMKKINGVIHEAQTLPKGYPNPDQVINGVPVKWIPVTANPPDRVVEEAQRERRRPMPAKQLPPWSTQVKNAAGAVGRVIKAVSTGKEVKVPEEKMLARQAICDDCPESTPAELPVKDRRCAQCGCFLSKKTMLATEKCPMGKW